MKIYFTSNLFISRRSKLKSRKFSSVQEMNETIVNNWNANINSDDIVYHLGNFAWDPLSAEQILSQLNGNIVFIPSEWDRAIYEIIDNFPQHHISESGIIYIEDKNLVLSYWPLLDWPGRTLKTIHIHGGSTATKISDNSIRINCNCDNWNLTPINMSTIHNLVEMFSK